MSPQVAPARGFAYKRGMNVIWLLFFACLTTSAPGADSTWNHPLREKIPGLQHGAFPSASMKVNVGYNIFLPPDYATNTAARYPVIYYLHGMDGHESSYPDYARMLAEAIRTRAVPPVILVLASGGGTSFFADALDSSVMGETCIVRELVPHIDANYRTVAAREGRSLHGYSMGGFGALKLGFKHPEVFDSVVAHAATLADAAQMKDNLGTVFTKMFGGDKKLFDASDPLVLVGQNADKFRGRLAIRIALGSKDEFLETNRQLHRRLEELKVPHEFEVIPGVSHSKDPLYKKVALQGFQFSARNFSQPK